MNQAATTLTRTADRRARDVAAQLFQLVAFVCFGRHAGMQ